MKKISIILALLFFAFSIEAQTVEKSKRTKERKTTSSSSAKRSERPAKTKTIRTPSASKSTSSRSSRTHSVKPSNPSKASATRSANRSASSPRIYQADKKSNTGRTTVNRSTTNRSNTINNTQARSTTNRSTATRSNTRTTSSAAQRAVSAKSSSRSNTSSVVNAPRNYNTHSVSNRAYKPRTSERDAAARRNFVINKPHRVNRVAPKIHYNYQSIDYRRTHKPYIIPRLLDIIWDASMYRTYRSWYPEFNLWYYPYGYRIHTVSAYDAYNYIGDIARIYGRISEVWYSVESNEYFLYIGGPYPYQDFTIILEARDARRFSRDPISYFTNRNITSTGLVSLYENKPEMLIRKTRQISLY
ncbi:MAG: hypothetical protein JW857_00215 [Bacteroidales bacterium]|nr:hypothetical protein [Bacteroidales bacterium]